jgi:hypothetical protein
MMRRRYLALDTVLTLIIAVGGIATGIGAIWTAMLARRQLSEQRRFLEEQNEIARSQTRLTERSLTEQGQSLQAQNERARLDLGVNLLFRYADRFENELFLRRRRAAARHLLDNAFVGEEMVGVERLNRAALDVCGLIEDLAYLQRIGALEAETVWNTFGWAVRAYWPLCKPAIEKDREEWGLPAMYEEFEGLSLVVAELERERGNEPPTEGWLRQAMKDEAIAGEDEAVIDKERPKPE